MCSGMSGSSCLYAFGGIILKGFARVKAGYGVSGAQIRGIQGLDGLRHVYLEVAKFALEG